MLFLLEPAPHEPFEDSHDDFVARDSPATLANEVREPFEACPFVKRYGYTRRTLDFDDFDDFDGFP